MNKILEKIVLSSTKLSTTDKMIRLAIGLIFLGLGLYLVDYLQIRNLLQWWGLLLVFPFYIGFMGFFQSRMSA